MTVTTRSPPAVTLTPFAVSTRVLPEPAFVPAVAKSAAPQIPASARARCSPVGPCTQTSSVAKPR